DKIEPPASVADLVERGTDAGDDTGVEKRRVDGRDNLEPLGYHGQGRSGCERVERGAPEPRRSKAGAATLGHEENLQSGLLQHLGYPAVVLEGRLCALLGPGDQHERRVTGGGQAPNRRGKYSQF